MARRRRNDHWLNTPWWILTLGEWIGLVLALGAIVSLLCILLIRRHTLEYHLEHTFAVSDAEFLGSALAISDPVPIEGNAIEVLQNGDEYFPAMLDAIRAAKKTINFEAYIVYSDEVDRAFCEALSECARAGVEVRVLLDGVGSSWSLNNSDVQMMKRAAASSPIIIRHIRGEWTGRIGAVTGAFWWWMGESDSPAELVLPNAGAGMPRTRSTGAMSICASEDLWWQSCNQLSRNTGRKRAQRN